MILRRKPPTIEFVTHTSKLAEVYPPVPAGRAAPEWWRNQPPFLKARKYANLRVRQDTTIKSCPGIGDYLSQGYIIPMWADHIITATSDGFEWDVACPPQIEMFRPEVWDHLPRPEGVHSYVLKIAAPWYIRTPKGVSVMLLGPWYHRNPYWTVFPGVMDSDRCPMLNLICMWHVPIGEAVLIKAGTPLFHLIPFRREKLALDIRADEEKFVDMTGTGMGSIDGFRRLSYGAYREDRLREEAKQQVRDQR